MGCDVEGVYASEIVLCCMRCLCGVRPSQCDDARLDYLPHFGSVVVVVAVVRARYRRRRGVYAAVVGVDVKDMERAIQER